MAGSWRQTDLSVSPPSYQIGHEDREIFGFDAEEALSEATALLTRLDTNVEESIDEVSVDGTVAAVVIEDLVRQVNYELAVTFELPSGRKYSRTLVIECVA